MDETLFYVFGIALVVSAVVLSAIGLRFESFPPSRAALAGRDRLLRGMVGATTTFAVLNASDEQHKREAEQARGRRDRSRRRAARPRPATTTTERPRHGARRRPLKLAAEPDAIAYDTTQLSGKAGQVTIDFTNPSPVAHDVCLEGPSGEQIGCSETITQGSASLAENLKPGKYTFFCSVAGHEAAGMKGTLTVKSTERRRHRLTPHDLAVDVPRHHVRLSDERARLRAHEGDARVARLSRRWPSAPTPT